MLQIVLCRFVESNTRICRNDCAFLSKIVYVSVTYAFVEKNSRICRKSNWNVPVFVESNTHICRNVSLVCRSFARICRGFPRICRNLILFVFVFQ